MGLVKKLGVARDAAGAELAGLKFLECDLSYDEFTDSTSTTGYYDIPQQLPAGCLVLGWSAQIVTAFLGDTTGTIAVGTSATADIFTCHTDPSAYTAAFVSGSPLDSVDINANANPVVNTATTVRITITGSSAWSNVTAGQMKFVLAYVDYRPTLAA
jgi:hypothetical protein